MKERELKLKSQCKPAKLLASVVSLVLGLLLICVNMPIMTVCLASLAK